MCPSARFKDQSGSSPSSGGAQTRRTKINYAFCRASKRRAASIACARILSGSYPHSFAIWWRIRRTSATIGLSFISLLQINVIKKGFRRHDVRTMKSRLAHNLFRQSISNSLAPFAYASPFALAGSGRQARPLRGHWLLGSSGRPFTSICSEQIYIPYRGSALPVLARGVRHPAPTRVGPVADVLCPSARFKNQSGSSPSPGGAQTRQTEINTADYTTRIADQAYSTRFVAINNCTANFEAVST